MQRISVPGLEAYAKTLGLTWLVEYWLTEVNTVKLSSHPTQQRHEVWLPSSVFGNEALWLPDIVQSLCKAALAERIDPAFSTLFFAKSYGELKGSKKKRFERQAQQVFWAWSHVDIWANDLRHEHWPELSKTDHESFALSVGQLAQHGQWQFLRTNEGVFSIAQQMAEIERRQLEPLVDFWSVLQDLGWEWREKHRSLYEYYRQLPRLSDNQTNNLGLLVQTVQEVSQILHFPIKPKLVEEEGRLVWLLR